jgi:hypothetical protein
VVVGLIDAGHVGEGDALLVILRVVAPGAAATDAEQAPRAPKLHLGPAGQPHDAAGMGRFGCGLR